MNLKYYKKDLERLSLIRGMTDREMEDLEEEFWLKVDAECERRDLMCERNEDLVLDPLWYWFDKNSGEYYIGTDRTQGQLNKPKYYGRGVVG